MDHLSIRNILDWARDSLSRPLGESLLVGLESVPAVGAVISCGESFLLSCVVSATGETVLHLVWFWCLWWHHVVMLEWFVFILSGAWVHYVVPWVAPGVRVGTVCCAVCPDRSPIGGTPGIGLGLCSGFPLSLGSEGVSFWYPISVWVPRGRRVVLDLCSCFDSRAIWRRLGMLGLANLKRLPWFCLCACACGALGLVFLWLHSCCVSLSDHEDDLVFLVGLVRAAPVELSTSVGVLCAVVVHPHVSVTSDVPDATVIHVATALRGRATCLVVAASLAGRILIAVWTAVALWWGSPFPSFSGVGAWWSGRRLVCGAGASSWSEEVADECREGLICGFGSSKPVGILVPFPIWVIGSPLACLHAFIAFLMLPSPVAHCDIRGGVAPVRRDLIAARLAVAIRVESQPSFPSRQGSCRDALPCRDLALVTVALPVVMGSRRVRSVRQDLVCLGCFRGCGWRVGMCPRAGLPLGPFGGERGRVWDAEVVVELFRCGPASPSHCLALHWFRSRVGRLGVGLQLGRAAVVDSCSCSDSLASLYRGGCRQESVASELESPECCFCNPFLGAVHGGTRGCSSLILWRVRGPGWFWLWALSLVKVLGSHGCGETFLLTWFLGVSRGGTWLFLPDLVEFASAFVGVPAALADPWVAARPLGSLAEGFGRSGRYKYVLHEFMRSVDVYELQ
ncbi:hypothetical protein Taro_008386 [Colocasia esculenta]|uniref:Uncharacterized protein n=1 Tax=Colocasia esculenta TaxID=4460 RepID=A0A843TTK8_COLES|nr:hypothetical protein [Colocasia esculenta]